MPIDPSIPLRAGQIGRRNDPVRNYANALAIKSGQQQMEIQRNALERDNAMRQAMAGAVLPDGSIDDAALEAAAAKSGDLSSVLGLRKYRSEERGRQASRQEKELASLIKGYEVASRFIGGAKDPESYATGLQRFGSLSPITMKVAEQLAETLPPGQWSPEANAELQKKLMGMPEQLKIALEERRTKAAERTAEAAYQGKMGTRFTNEMSPESINEASSKEWGKYLINNEYRRVDEEAENATNLLNSLYMSRNIEVPTGAFEPSKAWAASIAEGLGVDPEKVGLESAANAQSFNAIANRLVLAEMAAQKGPQTESDMKLIRTTVATLGDTPEARRFITDSAIAVNLRKARKRDFYQQYRAENGTFDGAGPAWNKWLKRTPLLAKNPNTGRPVFYHQFEEAAQAANPGMTADEVMGVWRQKYGGGNG